MALYAFRFISGKYQGGEFPIPDSGELLIGRSAELDMVLVEDMVSRKHARISAAGEKLELADLGSTNGTFVNGEKVEEVQLKLSDRVLIGTSILKVIPATEMSIDADTEMHAIREMMVDLGQRKPITTMSGELEDVPLPDLLQLFATNRKSGVLSIKGSVQGSIFIKEGQLRHAALIGQTQVPAMKVICRMVGWASGSFRLDPLAGDETFPHSFDESTESVLMEALRQLDELRRLERDMPARTARLQLCVPLTPKLSQLEARQLDVLQLVLNFGELGAILDADPALELELMQALDGLLKAGYIEAAD